MQTLAASRARISSVQVSAQHAQSRKTAQAIQARRHVLLGAGAAVAGLLQTPAPSLAAARSPFVSGPAEVMLVPYEGDNSVMFVRPLPKFVMTAMTWDTWEHGVDTFPYEYEHDEECYFLEGLVEVTPEGGQPVTIKKGDYVVFPAGMSCTWDIKVPVKKHFKEYL